MSDERRLSGVWPILVTPFDEVGEIDVASLARLVRGTLAVGVDGVVALGVNAEASKLSDRERDTIIGIVADVCRAEGKPFLVAVSHGGTKVAVERTRAAAHAGAWGVMVAPPPFSKPGPALAEHYRAIGTERVPVVIQDYPPETAVQLSAEAIADLLIAAGGRGGVKVEDPPTGPKIARLRTLLGPDVGLVGGLGGMHLLGELRRGADGAMTGFPFPQALLLVCRAMAAGDEDAAEATFRQGLPLLTMCGLPGVGLAVMKEVLKRRGLIRHAVLRQPGAALDGVGRRELERVLAALPAVDEPLRAAR